MSEPKYDAQDMAIADLAQQNHELLAEVRTLKADRDGWLTSYTLAVAEVRRLREALKVAEARIRTEAECDELNFPDKTEYGRFWSAWLAALDKSYDCL